MIISLLVAMDEQETGLARTTACPGIFPPT